MRDPKDIQRESSSQASQQIQRNLFRKIVSGWIDKQLVDYVAMSRHLGQADDEIVLAEIDKRFIDQTKRTTQNDRNSDQTLGSPKVHVSHNGRDRTNLLRAPETFRGSDADGGWDGRGVPSGGTSYRPASAGSSRGGSDSAQGGLDPQGLFRKPIAFPPAVRDLQTGRLIPNSENTPTYSKLSAVIGVITGLFLIAAVVILEVVRHAR